MTYGALLAELQSLTPEQLRQDVTVQVPYPDDQEYFGVDDGLWFADEDNDVLDKDTPILKIVG